MKNSNNASSGSKIQTNGNSREKSTEVTGADAGQFTVSLDEPVTVAPNESAKLQVNAAPDSAGEKSATVTVGHTGDNPQLEIGLSGKGVEPPPPPDTKAPDTRITSGPSGFTKNRTAKFSFKATEAGSRFQCKLDKVAFKACRSGQTYRNLRDGRHAFQVRAIDAAGNIDRSPAIREWSVDTVKPTISKPSPKPNAKIRNRKPTISAIVRDRGSELRAANIKLYVDGKPVKFSYNQKTDRLVYKSKVLSFGRHTVKVGATDAAKNRMVKTWRFLVVRR